METENSKKYRAVDPVSRFRWALSFPGVSPAAGKVLAALAYHADQQKLTCWPAIATLARETQVSERGVQCAIRQLEAAGAILTERSRGRTSNIYRLMIPPNPAEPAPTPQNLRGSTPQNLHPNPQNLHPPTPQNLHPNRVIFLNRVKNRVRRSSSSACASASPAAKSSTLLLPILLRIQRTRPGTPARSASVPGLSSSEPFASIAIPTDGERSTAARPYRTRIAGCWASRRRPSRNAWPKLMLRKPQ